VKKQVPHISAFELASASLSRESQLNVWHYRLFFGAISASSVATVNPVTAIVLLDGSIVEPRTEESGPADRGTGGLQGPGTATGRGGPRNLNVPVPDANGVYRQGFGIVSPVPVNTPKPQYTADAFRAKIEGSVHIQCIVQTSGECTDPKIVRSLDPRYGLDREALAAAKEYRFRPGLKDGLPVPVIVTIQLSFSIGN
jgi:TonB family protein